MVKQEDFAVEQFMDKYETHIDNNMGETCSDSLSVNQLFELVKSADPKFSVEEQQKLLTDKLLNTKLTYGHIRGSPALKEAICALYNDDSGKVGGDITEENIVISNGAIGANFLTLYSLVNADDKVIVVDPTYQQLSSVSSVFSQNKKNVVQFPLKFENGFLPDLEELKSLIKEHSPKLVIINNPNNPTGIVWSDAIVSEIVEICKADDIWLMCDEVYRPLYHSVPQDEQPKSIINYGYTKSISTSSTSKAFAFAGLRLGWVVSREKSLIRDLFSKRDYNTIAVSTVDDFIATLVIQNYKTVLQRSYDICLENIKVIQKAIDESNGLLSWVKPRGGTTCFIKINIPNIDTYKLCSELAENYGTLVVPGEVFGNRSGFLRVGFGNQAMSIKNGFIELNKWFKNNGY
ncbi:aspartate aminotransferase [Scheffersomyces xylosifermentans]|uniref:aspartate aminotransferase n=1 Tax=Scheffersomyces xylosifermentans TaxID=1304137 RepID=UPI00315C95E3